MTDSGGEEHNDNDGEPTSTNGAIADGGDRAGGGGGGRGGVGRDWSDSKTLFVFATHKHKFERI